MYKNQEGYSDPTAGAVMKKLMTEYNRKKRADRRKAQRKKQRANTPKRTPKEGTHDDTL